MAKRKIKPATLLNPLPVCLITCQAEGSAPNILTVAAIGICCFDPPLIVDEEYLDPAGNWRRELLQPLAYHLLSREYWSLGESLGIHGFTKTSSL
jgi:hypothetical protein